MSNVAGDVLCGRKKQKSRLFVLLLPEGLEFAIPLRLFLALLDEVSDGIALEHLLGVEYLVEVLLEFLPTLLDVLGALVGDAEDLLLGEGRTKWPAVYRFLMLLS